MDELLVLATRWGKVQQRGILEDVTSKYSLKVEISQINGVLGQ